MAKNELEKALWAIWTYDHRIPEPFAEELQDKANFNVRAVMSIIERMFDAFPQGDSPCWTDPEGELAYWKNINLDGQNSTVGTWIKRRIETLEWLQKWIGVKRVKQLKRNYVEYYKGFEIYRDREGGLNAELQSKPRFSARTATNESLVRIKAQIDIEAKRMGRNRDGR